MTKQKYHNQSIPEDVFEQFSGVEKEQVKEVWEKTAQLSGAAGVSQPEVEQALENVHERIASSEKPDLKKIQYLRVWLTAAVALIVFSAGWLLVPKTLTVPNGEMAVYELPDGSSVEMNSGTTIRYSRLFSYNNRSITLNGEAYFDVQEADLPFIVEANGTVTEVTGTRFNIRSWSDDPENETSVAVTEGEVGFYRAGNATQKITLSPGEISRWNSALSEPASPEPVSAGDVLGWREQRFVFQDRPLLAIFNELERRFDVDIDLEAPGYSLETLTAYYREPGDLERVLEDICMVKGLRFAETANGYRVFK